MPFTGASLVKFFFLTNGSHVNEQVIVGLISCVFLLVTARKYGLAGVWGGLFLFMTLRVVAGVLR